MCGSCDRQYLESLGREVTPRPRPLEERIREAFVKYLTEDVMPKGKRASKWQSQAIFDPSEGWAVFSRTDLSMVLDKFDLAMQNIPNY